MADGSLVTVSRPYNRASPDRVQVLLRALESGYTRTAACRLAGISTRHFFHLMASGKRVESLPDSTDSTHPPTSLESEPLTFAELVEEAEAAAQGSAETVILSRISIDPALAWRWLRRRRRADWGDPEAEKRIEEIEQRIRLAKLEERLAEMELLLLQREREIPEEGGSHASSGQSSSSASPTSQIEIEYFDPVPSQNPDSEAL